MLSKKLNKIFLKIDSFAKKGNIGKVEYFAYINDIVKNGQYLDLQDVLQIKYGIDTNEMSTIENVKKRTFDLIRFKTYSKFQEDLKKIYDESSVIQIGQNIYLNNENIGKIIEGENTLEIYSEYGYTFSSSDDSIINQYDYAISYLIDSVTTSTTTTTTTA